MAYSGWQRRPLSIPDHTLLAIGHMLFSSERDERRLTRKSSGSAIAAEALMSNAG